MTPYVCRSLHVIAADNNNTESSNTLPYCLTIALPAARGPCMLWGSRLCPSAERGRQTPSLRQPEKWAKAIRSGSIRQRVPCRAAPLTERVWSTVSLWAACTKPWLVDVPSARAHSLNCPRPSIDVYLPTTKPPPARQQLQSSEKVRSTIVSCAANETQTPRLLQRLCKEGEKGPPLKYPRKPNSS